MGNNKTWRGWATNFGDGDGMVPFVSHAPTLPESYEIVLLPVADFDALCAELERLDEITNSGSTDSVLSQCNRPARVTEILERWKEQQL